MELIKGKHAVLEAIKSEANIDRIIVAFQSNRDPVVKRIIGTAKANQIKSQVVPAKEFEKITAEKHAQGVVAFIRPKEMIEIEDITQNTEKYPFVIILDHLEDPHNFGAILRSCEAFGVNAVIYPKDRSCQITPGMVKASAGAIHYVDLCRVVNLARTITLLKDAGFWVYGTTANNGQDLSKIKPNFPLALVMGNEHSGLSRLVEQSLDEAIQIPMKGEISSLNVSVAAGVLLYELSSHINS